MIVYSLLIATLLLAGISLFLLVKPKDTWPRLALAISMASFTYLYGAWIYLSFYTKWGFGLCCIIALIVGLMRRKTITKPRTNFRRILNIFVALIFASMSVLYFTGTTRVSKTIPLQFPLKHGDYFILQGGKGLPANVFHTTGRGTLYAMDLVRLDDYGRRCKHIFSKQLDDYFIYGDTVYSPCSGIIQRAIDDNPDNIPPNRQRGPHNLNGVLIEGEHCYVFLGHLKQGAVFVHKGDRVDAGTPLGLAGNSGFSIEPHLHIQAHAKTNSGLLWYQEEGLMIEFNGKSYLLFERIKSASLPANILPE